MYYDIALFKIIVLKVQDVHTCILLMQAHIMAREHECQESSECFWKVSLRVNKGFTDQSDQFTDS